MEPRNPYLCLTIVATLGTCAALCIVGMIVASIVGHDVPPSLVAIASGAIGSLSSFLVSVPRGSAGFVDDRKKVS